MNDGNQSSRLLQRLEGLSVILLSMGIAVLLVLQLSSLYVAPVHDSQLFWYGDESWLMNEYKEQVQTGVFRHPGAFASTIAVSNPFPFTAMWVTSLIYGGSATLFPQANQIDVGRTISAIIALLIVIAILWRVRRSSLLSALCGVALLISCRSFLLASHSARYDIITAGAVLLVMVYLERKEQFNSRELLIIGHSLGACLLISAHASVILLLPVAYVALRNQRNPLKLIPMALCSVGVVSALYVIHVVTQPHAANAHDITSGMGDQPYLHPFSPSFQRYNLQQKLQVITDVALPMILMIAVVIAGNFRKGAKSWSQIVFWLLPMAGWFFLEGSAVRYIIYIVPALAFGAALSMGRLRSVSRLTIVAVTMVTVIVASRDALQARSNGDLLSRNVASALDSARSYMGDGPVVAMSPALSDLEDDPAFRDRVYTTHFVWLPNIPERTGRKEASLLMFVKQNDYDFSWEVPILRKDIGRPSFMRAGKFLDARSNYFEPLDASIDTLLLQHLDLDTFLQNYRR